MTSCPHLSVYSSAELADGFNQDRINKMTGMEGDATTELAGSCYNGVGKAIRLTQAKVDKVCNCKYEKCKRYRG